MMPDFALEDSLDGSTCGIDEVGRGPLAGPVVSAAVHIPDHVQPLPFIDKIKDSKKLSKSKRETLFEEISNHCNIGVAIVSVEDIDRLNILGATMHAMRLAYDELGEQLTITHALIDGNKAPELPCSCTTVIKGDNVSTSIAAASIIAKVTRDRIMAELAIEFPDYGWESNVGYGAKTHIDAIHAIGVTPHHRRSFEPVKSLLLRHSERA